MPKHSNKNSDIEKLREQIIGLGEDSIRKSYYSKLRYHIEELERFRALLDQSKDMIMLIDLHTKEIIDINYTVSFEYGVDKTEILGKNANTFFPSKIVKNIDIIEKGDIEELKNCCIVEVEIKTKRGDVPVEFSLQRIEFEENSYVVIIGSNITERQRAKQKIYELDYYDTLTGLANNKKLKQTIAKLKEEKNLKEKYSGILLIDIDNFKSINDTKGHNTGDKLLIQISQRLKKLQEEGLTLYKSGGDEFVILVSDLATSINKAFLAIDKLAFRVKNIINQPYIIDDEEFLFSSSIGVEIFKIDIFPQDNILKHAEIAMYESKKQGRNTISFYDPRMQEAIQEKISLEIEMKIALEKEQFYMYYQPQFDINENLIGLEALIRWNHPTKGLILPGEFIPFAEESGFIVPLGEWILKLVCKQLCEFAKAPQTKKLSISVNVSIKQFQDEYFTQKLANIIRATGTPKVGLLLELTESVFIEDIDNIIEKMNKIKELGVSFSMDDFGTGYSSLNSLKRLPLYEMKIDQSFVRDIPEDSNDAVIVKTIIGMAKNLGLKVVAEGVENIGQFEFLKKYNCEFYQGYFFSKPIPIQEVKKRFLS